MSNYLLIPLFIVSLSSVGKSAEPVGPCAQAAIKVRSDENRKDFQKGWFYEGGHLNRLLFLGDGQPIHFLGSLAGKIHHLYPSKKIMRTDIYFRNLTSSEDNYTVKKMDHSKKFTLEDDSFDAVIMRDGLCVCYFKQKALRKTCGGIKIKEKPSYQFFSEVVRVLDLNNPKSIAILEGGYGNNEKVVDIWRAAAAKVVSEQPVEFAFVYVDKEQTKFNRIEIRPRQ